MSGKLLYPRIVMLCVKDILALRSLALRVTIIEPRMVVVTTVLKIVDNWSVSFELNTLDKKLELVLAGGGCGYIA